MSWDTPLFAPSSSCARRRCFTTTTRCTPLSAELTPAGPHFSKLFPQRFQLWLYRWAMDRAHLDTILDRFVVDPLMRLSHLFAKLDYLGLQGPMRLPEEVPLSMRKAAIQRSE